MSTITISLPDSLKAFVEQEVSTQGYGNVSEYFRSLLRKAQARVSRQRLEERLLAGLEVDAVPTDSEFWSQLRLEAQRLASGHAPELTPWPANLARHRAALAALCKAHAVRELALVGAWTQAGAGPAVGPLEFAVHLGEVPGDALALSYANFSNALAALLDCPIDLIEIGTMGPTRLRRLLEQTRRVIYPSANRS